MMADFAFVGVDGPPLGNGSCDVSVVDPDKKVLATSCILALFSACRNRVVAALIFASRPASRGK